MEQMKKGYRPNGRRPFSVHIEYSKPLQIIKVIHSNRNMALPKDFPKDPYVILDPGIRWFPADEDLREKGFDKLIPPLVADLRKKVKEWRCKTYVGASDTAKKHFLWWC